MNVNIKKNSKLFKLLFAFLIITFFFSGCLKIVRVTGVKINGGDKYLKIGETLQLSVTIEPSDATNTAVTWESSDSSKVTVNEKGLVTAIAKLGAEITVITKDGKHEDTIAVYVGIANPNNPVNPVLPVIHVINVIPVTPVTRVIIVIYVTRATKITLVIPVIHAIPAIPVIPVIRMTRAISAILANRSPVILVIRMEDVIILVNVNLALAIPVIEIGTEDN